VSSSFLNMVQQDIPRDVLFDADTAGSRNQLFAEKLSKTMEKASGAKDEAPSQTQIDPASQDPETIMEFLSEKLGREKGINFVSGLKNFFLMLSNGNLKNVSIDGDGLEALKKMLLKAGFAEDELNVLIAELSEEFENKTLTLDDVLDKLFALPLDEKSDTALLQDNYLETSALPFLETILNAFGISQEKIQEIFSEADKGEKGISLDVVLEKLQPLQKASFYTGNQYKTQEGDDSFKLLFKQLGLEHDTPKTSGLTLDEFVDSLSKLRQTMAQQQMGGEGLKDINQKAMADEKSMDLFKTLFKGLELVKKPADTKVFEFSYEQIRDQFENELLVPGNGKLDKKGLFSLNKEVKHSNSEKQGFKDIELLLNGKKPGYAGDKEQAGNGKEFIRQLKSKTAKFSDQGQVTLSDAKSSETQSTQNILKSKPSFKNLPTYVTQQLSKSLVRAINQGENILKIQLKPPELGRLVMTIDNTGNSMKISIMTENHAAKEILISNINELKTVLSNSGVNLEKFEVDMNSDFKQSMADARNQAENSGKRHKNREKQLMDPANGEGINDRVSLLDILNQDGSLHFVA
ncbi:MAG: flagellar hook-length control protein FliK, partial [Proteobacteria bacterium]|nr:flagellar hook-length control protein FliK [Pseudomonadota bacterium]